MSIQTLLKLANEFETISANPERTIDSRGPLPVSKVQKKAPYDETTIRNSEETVMSLTDLEEVPQPTLRSEQVPTHNTFAMNMDYSEVVHSLREFIKNEAPRVHIGPIRKSDYAGLHFSVTGNPPAAALVIFRKMTIFLKNRYRSDDPNFSYNASGNLVYNSKADRPGSAAEPSWAELRYPDEDTVMTLIQRGNNITFKITTIEQ